MCRKLICLISFVLVLSLIPSSPTKAADPDLIGWWKLDEGSGDTAIDLSGSGNDGTIHNADSGGLGDGGSVWVNDPERGIVLSFNGNDSGGAYVSTDLIIPFMSLDNDFTWAFWTKQHTDQATNNDTILGNRYGGTPTPGSGQFIKFTPTRFEFFNDDPSYLEGINYGSIPGGVWVHHVIVKDGTSLTYYRNGEEAGTNTITKTIDPNPFSFGGDATNVTEMWQGYMSDVRLYTKALTQNEVLGVMEGTGEVWPYASSPDPADGAVYLDTWVTLGWRPGGHAVSHDVYLGDNFDDVNDGTGDTFRGNQADTYFVAGFPGFPYPDGLVPGTTYYWRIDEVNDADPNSPWKGKVWSFWIPPKTAYDPKPVDGVKFVDTDVELVWTAGFKTKLHYVYFGDNFDDVNSAVMGIPQATTAYSPGTLEPGKSYYWRIDEFDGVATHKGDVWSFSTIPIIDITDPSLMGWWKLDEDMGTTAVDWSGHGNHGNFVGDPQWVPGYDGSALEFDGLDYVDTGYTENLANWTITAWVISPEAPSSAAPSGPVHRENNYQFNWNHSDATFRAAAALNVGGTWYAAKYEPLGANKWYHLAATYDGDVLRAYRDGVLITSNSAPSGTPNAEGNSLKLGRHAAAAQYFTGTVDNVRVYNRALTEEEIQQAMRGDPLVAWGPKPANGSIVHIRDATPLSWSPGDEASQHDVYFGLDKSSVADADASDTTGIYRGRQNTTNYNPPEGVEWGGGPYYWRIDEYNTDTTISKGNVWSFTVADYITVDDFEAYNDLDPELPGSNRIFLTWVDGYEQPTNGSQVGYLDPPFCEQSIVHSGGQSMPLFYNNSGPAYYSEATLPLTYPRDWTEEAVGILTLWFYGDPANVAESMYVAVANATGPTAVVYHDNPDAALIDTWTPWNINLEEISNQGVVLTNVDSFAIGFGNRNNPQVGGTGMVFIDDIRLYRPTP